MNYQRNYKFIKVSPLALVKGLDIHNEFLIKRTWRKLENDEEKIDVLKCLAKVFDVQLVSDQLRTCIYFSFNTASLRNLMPLFGYDFCWPQKICQQVSSSLASTWANFGTLGLEIQPEDCSGNGHGRCLIMRDKTFGHQQRDQLWMQ